jgi:hypothetical protein
MNQDETGQGYFQNFAIADLLEIRGYGGLLIWRRCKVSPAPLPGFQRILST